MAGTCKWVDRNRPCRICGKTDYCKYVEFPSGDTKEYCHRIFGDKGSFTTGKDGKTYICHNTTEWGFQIWEPEEQYRKNRESFMRVNGFHSKEGTTSKNAIHSVQTIERKEYIDLGEALPPEKLDEIYSYFLSLLTLEEKHRNILSHEWNPVQGLFQKITKQWMIRSIPPTDRNRRLSGENLKNPSRRAIMQKMTQEFGSLKGVPGFFRYEDGTQDMSPLAGIAYPIYNSRGQIIRIRIADDYPIVEGVYESKDGIYQYYNGQWLFCGNGCTEGSIVWRNNGAKKVILNEKGYPPGKVKGKYKNFSSFKEIEKNGKRMNKYIDGTQSGSKVSLYAKGTDNWDIVYVTEGEKKAIVANMILGHPVISVPGVSAFGALFKPEDGINLSIIEELIRHGTTLFVIAYDSDKGQNANVLKSEKDLIMKFMQKGLKIAISEWNPKWGKGFDDILLINLRPEIMLIS